MSETDDTSLARSESSAPSVRTRPEEDFSWIIAAYSRHRLRELTQELDKDLGENRGPQCYLPLCYLTQIQFTIVKVCRNKFSPIPVRLMKIFLILENRICFLKLPPAWEKYFPESLSGIAASEGRSRGIPTDSLSGPWPASKRVRVQ